MKSTLLILIASVTTCFAQDTFTTEKIINGIFLETKSFQQDFYYEMPFEYSGQIITEARVNGQPYNFIFDTGGYTMLSSEVTSQTGLFVFAQQNIGSTNNIIKKTDVVKVPEFNIGGLDFINTIAYCNEFDNSPKLNCMANGGIIGSSIINKYVWQIDYSQHKLIVTDNKAKLNISADAIRIPVLLNVYQQPYVLARINGKLDYIIFDTGCSYPMWLSANDAYIIKKLVTQAASIKGFPVETHNGNTRDDIELLNTETKLQDVTLANLPAFYKTKDNPLSLLGNPIIKDYIVTLNIPEGELYLQPIHSNSNTTTYKSHGATFEYTNSSIVIESITANSVAEKAGLQPGDTIEIINGKKMPCNNYCDCRAYFSTLYNSDAPITITVKGKSITLNLENVFK